MQEDHRSEAVLMGVNFQELIIKLSLKGHDLDFEYRLYVDKTLSVRGIHVPSAEHFWRKAS